MHHDAVVKRITISLEDDLYRVEKAYGSNYDRLVALKKKYDPENFFRTNMNINPS